MGAAKAPIFLSFECMLPNPAAALWLAVESTHPGVILLGIDIKGLVFDVVVPFLELPVHILGLEDLANAGFENQYIVDSGDLFCLQDALEFNTPVCKMPDHGKGILFLGPFFQGALIDDGQSSDFCWFA